MPTRRGGGKEEDEGRGQDGARDEDGLRADVALLKKNNDTFIRNIKKQNQVIAEQNEALGRQRAELERLAGRVEALERLLERGEKDEGRRQIAFAVDEAAEQAKEDAAAFDARVFRVLQRELEGCAYMKSVVEAIRTLDGEIEQIREYLNTFA
ncbi:hypothetical protein GMRT_16388 [Giardia muris]|uniref:Uncharacterized protein n=1 Tax=Giardia muris TaxID=5742 RepID=A0A4Z1T1X8_GIAMU|nr:hypothetical protein GMRT_16388 [Giardia muris]|eukprot:TNJ26569.1 hypothetical protein GMRT_16388 [Giardia muris]